jgi:YD repeat-containing protein
MHARSLACLSTWVLTGVAAWSASAADLIPQQEYHKYIDKHRTIQALDSSLFGEQINLRDGGVAFKITDAELPGNGPTIRIVRSFKLRENNRFVETTGTGLGGWMLEVPRLKTITNNTVNTDATSVVGWQVYTGSTSGKDLRCSNFGGPGDITFLDPVKYWQPYEWWSGYQLVDDNGNEQPLLGVVPGNPMTGFKAMTTNNWRFECLPATANGVPGEGFKGFAPDGTVYWFDYLVYTTADNVTKPYGGTPMAMAAQGSRTARPQRGAQRDSVTTLAPVNDILVRRHAMLLVTRIEDRFGNYLTYSYTAGGSLTGITASDGRTLTVGSSGGTPTITLNSGAAARTWTYASNATTDTYGSAYGGRRSLGG